MPKRRINISIDEDTEERLQQYAWEHHSTVSKAITDLVWDAKVKNDNIRGQMSLPTQKDIRKKRAARPSYSCVLPCPHDAAGSTAMPKGVQDGQKN